MIMISCIFMANAAEESKYEYHDSSWYLSEEEATAFMGFIYNLAPEDLADKEFTSLGVDLLTGKYADSPEDEYIIKMTFCEVALTQMNSKVSKYDHASVITSENLISWLQSQVGENPTEDYINSTCNGYLGKIKDSIKKTLLICNLSDRELEIYEDFDFYFSEFETVTDIPKKAESYAKAVKAGVEAVLYASSSSRSAMYQYFLSYVKTRDLADSTIAGFELAMNYNVLALVNQGLYDPFLNWAAEDNQKVLNKWAELFYWLMKDIGEVEFTNDNTSGTTSSTLEPVEFVPGTGTYEGKCGEKVKWHLDASTGILNIYGEGSMDNYTSASKTPWYNYRQYINYVRVTDGVIYIGNYAFAECTTLDKVYLAADVYNIGDRAFYNCVAMRLFVIDGIVNNIGEYTFANCKNLVYFNVPERVTNISNELFYGCTNLVTVDLPENLVTIGVSAFSGCTSLVTVGGIPSTVTSLGQYCFYGCTSLSDSIIIPSGVTNISYMTFYDCQKISSIVIQNGITKIEAYAFYNCKNLTEITIPESVTTLQHGVFLYCNGLKEITIPASIDIGSSDDFVFDECKNIEKVTLTKGTGTMFISTNTYTPWCNSKTKLKEVVIEEGVTNIINNAFNNCTALEKVTLPESITIIGGSAFRNCTSLAEITIPNKDCTVYDSSSTIYSKTTIKAPCGSSAHDYAKKYSRTFVATEHTLTEWLADFTVNGDVMTTTVYRECIYCGEAFDLTTHTTSGWIVDTETTCTTEGNKHLECLDCGNRYDAIIPATGHTEVVDKAISATCTEAGLTEGKHCSVCSTILVEQTVVDALGHDTGDWYESLASSCTEKGEERTDCSRCDYFETRETQPNGHSYTAVITVPTCTEGGYTTYTCSCSDTYTSDETEALGHNMSGFVQTVSPTCTEKGVTRSDCSRCDHYETAEVDMLPHTESQWIIDKDATCTKEGSKHIECTKCHTTLKTETIQKTDHNYGKTVVAPTCIESGYTIYTCIECTYSYISDETAATGHNYDSGVCTNCGDSKTDDCSCNCHKSGFMGFIWKILNFFYKLFGMNKACECGIAHY